MNFDKSVIKRLVVFITGNVFAQGLAALSGLLLAQWLSVNDYAAYTVVVVLMGAITLLTKGGAHLGYTAILGRVWPNMNKVGEAVKTVLYVRSKISIIFMPIILVMVFFLLERINVNLLSIFSVLILLILFWWADMRTKLLDQVLFFAKKTTKIQLLDSKLSILKFISIVFLYYFDVLNLLTAILVVVLISILRVKPILSWVIHLVPYNKEKINKDNLSEISIGVKRQLPVDIYMVLQPQIVLFALSIYATTSDIAGLGALGRINQLLLPVEAVTFAFLVPYFAQASERKALKIFFPLIIISVIPGICLLSLSYYFPEILLKLVGPNYSNLHFEIFLATLMAALYRVVHTGWALLAHRGWVKYSWLQIPIGLTLSVLGIIFLDLSQLSNAILLQISFIVGILVSTTFDYYSTLKKVYV